MKLRYAHPVTVAAHRGDSGAFAENTMAAFRAAVAMHVDMIETDIHLTRDNVLVLMHDDRVDRTTDGTGLIRDFTYAELRRLNCNPGGQFTRIPTLEEFLELCAENGIMVNLEIKEYYSEENAERCRLCVRKTLELVEYFGMAEKTIINSFDAYVLEYTNQYGHGKYMLHGFYPYSIMRNVKENPDDYLYCACIFDDRNPEHYEYLRSRGIEPWAGAGVKEKEHFAACVENGAVLFTTNYPADAMRILNEIGKR